MDFVYQAALPADEIHVEIQHPLKQRILFDSDTKDSHKDDEGFTYHSYTFNQVTEGQKVSTSIAHSKTDPKPSISGQPKTGIAAPNAPSDNGVNPNVMVLSSALVIALGMVGYFVWERRAGKSQYARTPASRASPKTLSGGFCTECGNALDAEDKFCGKCGTSRR
jgi:hypothetical protein